MTSIESLKSISFYFTRGRKTFFGFFKLKHDILFHFNQSGALVIPEDFYYSFAPFLSMFPKKAKKIVFFFKNNIDTPFFANIPFEDFCRIAAASKWRVSPLPHAHALTRAPAEPPTF